MIDGIAVRHGRLDLLVNNAGGSPYADAATASPRFSESILALNLLAPIHLSQAAYSLMAAQEGGGLIINISSVSSRRPSPGTAV
ncbi:SDR family NAD(P)-dependent oxidoreductase, partial [Rhizobiaceae sp. 2RAB30]